MCESRFVPLIFPSFANVPMGAHGLNCSLVTFNLVESTSVPAFSRIRFSFLL